MDVLGWVMKWFESHCDEDWEHQRGLKIETLDNPGWAVHIGLDETELDDKTFDALKVERTIASTYRTQLIRADGKTLK